MTPPSDTPTTRPPPASERPTDPAPGAPRSEVTGDSLDLAMVALGLAVEVDVDQLRSELAKAIEVLAAIEPIENCPEYVLVVHDSRFRIEVRVTK